MPIVPPTKPGGISTADPTLTIEDLENPENFERLKNGTLLPWFELQRLMYEAIAKGNDEIFSYLKNNFAICVSNGMQPIEIDELLKLNFPFHLSTFESAIDCYNFDVLEYMFSPEMLIKICDDYKIRPFNTIYNYILRNRNHEALKLLINIAKKYSMDSELASYYCLPENEHLDFALQMYHPFLTEISIECINVLVQLGLKADQKEIDYFYQQYSIKI